MIEQSFGFSPKIIGYLISFQGIISAIAGFFTGRISQYYKNSSKELFHSSFLLTLSLLSLTVAPSYIILVLSLIPLCISSTVIRVSSSAITIGRTKSDKVRFFQIIIIILFQKAFCDQNELKIIVRLFNISSDNKCIKSTHSWSLRRI